MANGVLGQRGQETEQREPERVFLPEPTEQEKCSQRGGTWDPISQTCIFPAKKPKEKPRPEVDTEGAVLRRKSGTNYISPITGEVISKEAYEQEKQQITTGQALTRGQAQQAEESQRLAAQIGQFAPTPIEPTGLDFGEALTSGVVDAIPNALKLAATGAGVGLTAGLAGGPAAPITVPAGAAVGAVAGFVGGISSGIISSFKGQRRDTTTAQQRVLDEGKQTMKDWATMAEADPANRAFYLSEYNKVAAQIDAAYRQMKLDTSRDLAKFETALPNLAEFEAFYAAGGERDVLEIEMRNALISPSSPEYKLMELAQRRGVTS